jgi:DNA-binding NarL/FixJ family response regulator
MFKTLLVDDNDSFRRSLRSVLERHFPFMTIEEAASGAAALRPVRELQLVFMDIRLPDANGLELTRRLKAVHPDALVCVVTQFDIPEYREAADRSGADEFILKESFTEAAIVGLVQSMLAARAAGGSEPAVAGPLRSAG